jgi:ABC-type branched-subunit amino acid transport system substrate-binding protein
MALYVDLDGMEPEDAADAWLADHCDRWTGWSGADTSACPAAPVAAETLYDYGVTDDTIRIGAIADLSGRFAGLTTLIVDAQSVYWDMVNANGGIDGKEVEFVVLDNGYDVATHLERYEVMRDTGSSGVVILSNSTGSPHTAAIAETLVEDDLAAVPLSWYSGWPETDYGANVFENGTNYCYEGMNGVEYIAANMIDGEPKLAVISFPGEYGQDGAVGAKMAADILGIEVVYDGEAAIIPGADQTPVITGLVESGANMVWLTSSPGLTAEIMGGAAAQGFEAVWSGNSPSYNPALLASPLAPYMEANYLISTYNLAWGSSASPGMVEMEQEMLAARPDAAISDAYVVGWLEGMAAHQILEQAAENKDMTRAGVVAAANQVTVDYGGLTPNQSWSGAPGDNVVRSSVLFEIDTSIYTPNATIAEGGSLGSVLLEASYTGTIAAAHEYDGACFSAS